MSGEKSNILHTTRQLSSTLSELLKKLQSFNSKTKQPSASPLPQHTVKLKKKLKRNIAFNVLTQDMMTSHTRSTKPYRGNRLPKTTVRTLEDWFNRNFDCPYLKRSSLRTLIRQTNLSALQIKNWVSNRRRKERSLVASLNPSKSFRKEI